MKRSSLERLSEQVEILNEKQNQRWGIEIMAHCYTESNLDFEHNKEISL